MLNKKTDQNVMKKKLIVLVAGGTGGHLFPALVIAEKIKKEKGNCQIYSDKRCENILKENSYDFKIIFSSPIKFKSIEFFLNIIKIFFGIIQSLFYFSLKKTRPSLVVGFGGYTCFPSIIAAYILKIPIIIHEQNAIMGLTNRILSKLSNKIALSFKNTMYASKNSTYTGMPIRKEFYTTNGNINNNKIFFLIIGGSQGAHFFSKLIPDILFSLSNRELSKLSIVQQAKTSEIKKLENIYKKMNVDYKVKSFFNNIAAEMKQADIIFSRTGASSLAEIKACSKFSILFPLPNSADNHQRENAREFSKNNKCLILDEKNINMNRLKSRIKSLILNPKRRIKKDIFNKDKTNVHTFFELIRNTMEKS